MDYKGFKNELENYYKYLKEADKLKQELDIILYEMTGVKGIRYDKQRGSYNPQLSSDRLHDLMQKKEEKEIELQHVLASIKYLQLKISKLSEEDKQICLKVISEGISSETVRQEVGYSRSGFWKRIKRELQKIL